MSSLENFRIKDGVLYEYTGTDPHIVIPDTVTEIADYAFDSSTLIKSAVLPETVEKIGRFAFSYCAALESINIPSSVKSIGNSAFESCESLTEIDMSAGCVELISKRAFYGCLKLKRVCLPETVISIEKLAFYNCSELTYINIPDSVTDIGNRAFTYCVGLAQQNGLVIVNGVVYGYYGDSDSVTVPDGVRVIGENAFYRCKDIVSITLPDSLTEIEDYAFWGCESLKRMEIPPFVTTIGKGVFVDCTSIESISFPASVKCIDEYLLSGVDIFHEMVMPSEVLTFAGSVYEQVWNAEYNNYMKPVVATSFIKYASDSILFDPAIHKKLKASKKIIIAHALRYDEPEVIIKLFSWFKKISIDELDSYIADSKDAPLCRAFLMEYKNQKYSVLQQERAEEDRTDKELGLKPLSVAEYKKLYRYDVTENGIILTSYKGDDGELVIPSVIGKYDVVAIAEYCFSPDQPRLVWEKRRSRRAITAVTIPDSVSDVSDSAFEGCEQLTLYGSKGSYAEKYAEARNIPFVSMD